MDFCGEPLGLGELLLAIGLADLVVGLKSAGISSTKLEGKTPIALLSRHSLPVHHEPSPALRHSIRSPSMKPRSRLLCKDIGIGQSGCRTLDSWCRMGKKQHWHSRLLGRTDRRKVGNSCSSILSSHAPLLPTSRQPEPNKGTASGLVVVREPYLCRVARRQSGWVGRSGAVGLEFPSLSSALEPARTHTAADGRCRLGLACYACLPWWELPCRSGARVGCYVNDTACQVFGKSVGRPHTNNLELQAKATWEQGVSDCDEQAGQKQQSNHKQQSKKAYSPKKRPPWVWTDGPGAAEDGMDPGQTELEL